MYVCVYVGVCACVCVCGGGCLLDILLIKANKNVVFDIQAS